MVWCDCSVYSGIVLNSIGCVVFMCGVVWCGIRCVVVMLVFVSWSGTVRCVLCSKCEMFGDV